MGTSLLPQLTVYGALLVAAAILGFWPELKQIMHSLRDRSGGRR